MPCPVSNAAPSTYCACWMCSAKFGSQKMGENPQTLSEICGAWWFCWAHITIVLRPNCWGILAITAGSAILTVTDSAQAILLYYILNIIYYIIYHIIHIILYILYYIYYIIYIILNILYYICYIILYIYYKFKIILYILYYIYYMFPVPGPVAHPNGMVPYSVT